MMSDTREIWTQLHTGLLNFIKRRVSNRDEAEDILQEVFVRIHANIGKLNDATRVRSWVYQITRNAITDRYRTTAKKQAIPEPLDSRTEDNEAPVERELASCIQPLLHALPAEYCEALLLTEIEGLTQKTAAEQIGLSLSGMKSRVQRGRERLKQKLFECCHVEFDRRGGVVDYQVQDCSVCEPDCNPVDSDQRR